jgi:muramoyltetrapeptide carboxypeptidase
MVAKTNKINKTIIPEKLKKGDEIRVIAPARSLSLLTKENISIAVKALVSEGFKVTFSKHCSEKDMFMSSSIESRIEDLHEAFRDKNVKAMFTVIGGFNSNQLLKYIDYALIKKNPKIICGYSDITALSNAIYAKTGVVTYSGFHFSSWGMKKGTEYIKEYFKKCMMQKSPFEIKSSEKWSDDPWYKEQEKREFIKNKGYVVINEGSAEGTTIGANLCTFNLLHGTDYMPSLKNTILFLEEDDMAGDHASLEFDRNLQSIIHQPGFEDVKGIIIGRFQKKSNIDMDKLKYIISTKKELDNIPVIANADFGHTTPMFTFPIGGTAKIYAKNGEVKLEIIEH